MHMLNTGPVTENCNFSFAVLDMSLLWNIFLFAKKTLFPRAVLSFISSSILLSVFTVDPRSNFFNLFVFNIYGF